MNAIELRAVVKHYGGLRPLRMRELVVTRGEIVAIGGLDLPSTEVFTGLVTGTVLPDEGTVRVLGEDTRSISDPDGWLAALDRFGVASARVALLDGFTVEQNIAVPLTLELDALPADVVRAVRSVADLAGIPPDLLGTPAGALPPTMQFKLRLARAVSPSPPILIVEHPAGSVPAGDLRSVVSTVQNLVRHRGMTAVIVAQDADSGRIADRHLTLNAATGQFKTAGLRGWFS